jgi:hypothetical protein
MKPDLWSEYDKVQERLRAARERTAQAQAEEQRAHERMTQAQAEERAIEAEAVSARAAIERAVAEAAPKPFEKKAKSATTSSAPPLDGFPSMANVRVVEPNAGDGAPSVSRPAPDGVRSTVWEVILAIPRDGELRGSDLREKLGLSEGAVNTRLSNAKHARMIETSGWGTYRLTDQGRKLLGQHLRVVNDE